MAELTIGLNNVCTKLGSMESALQERQRLEIPDIAKPNELEPVDDRLSDLRKCASIDAVQKLLPELEKEADFLFCSLCLPREAIGPEQQKGKFN